MFNAYLCLSVNNVKYAHIHYTTDDFVSAQPFLLNNKVNMTGLNMFLPGSALITAAEFLSNYSNLL